MAKTRNDRIVALYKSGLSCVVVGAMFGVSGARIWQILRDLGCPRRPHRMDIDSVAYARAKRMYEDGLPIAAAAKAIGLKYKVLVHRLVEDGSHMPVDTRQAWSVAEIAFLRKNYRVLSARQIAEKLGRTRNEVIGKGNRLMPASVLEAAE